jgi:hypothetical protein
MKKLVIGVVIGGGAVLGVRQALRHAHKVCENCCGSHRRCNCGHSATEASL